MSDKPTNVVGSIASIIKTANEVDRKPCQISLPGEGRITFPDPMKMEAFESEALLHTVLTANSKVSLRKWLSEEDFEKLEELKLDRRSLLTLTKKVTDYYDDVFGGAAGEEDASRS